MPRHAPVTRQMRPCSDGTIFSEKKEMFAEKEVTKIKNM
jgi:hypothetical protein